MSISHRGDDVPIYPTVPRDTNSKRARSRLSLFLKEHEKVLRLTTHDLQCIYNLANAFYFRPTVDPSDIKFIDNRTMVFIRIPGMVEDESGWLTIKRRFLDGGGAWKVLDLSVIFIHGEYATVCDCTIPYRPD